MRHTTNPVQEMREYLGLPSYVLEPDGIVPPDATAAIVALARKVRELEAEIKALRGEKGTSSD